MAREIRYGMVGGSLGAFIGDVHRKAIGLDPRAELVCGCFSSRNAEKNKETARTYNISPERTYSSYKEMALAEAEREDGIDFVSICTPNVTHYEIAKEFLEKGINVSCEKPLCFEVDQAKELEALAKEKDLLFVVTYTYPGYTMARVMKDMISQGKIGKIAAVNAEYAQDWLINELEPEEGKDGNFAVWRTDPKVSGISNCVGDIGTHIEAFVNYVTGLKIKRLLATTNKYSHPLELNANIIVEYDNGVNGGYWCSQIAAGHYNGLVVRVYGDKGSLEWFQEEPERLWYTPKGEAREMLTRAGSGFDVPAKNYGRLPVGHPEGIYVAFANIYRDYISALIAKKNGEAFDTDSLTMVDAGVDGVKFIHAVVESAEKDSAWVEM